MARRRSARGSARRRAEAATADALAASVPPRRGRPRGPETLVVNVRLSSELYDRYCVRALHARVPVRRLLRYILTRYAPTPSASRASRTDG